MTAAEFSLLALTFGFIALVAWVYAPGRRSRLESYSAMPLDEDEKRGSGSNDGCRGGGARP